MAYYFPEGKPGPICDAIISDEQIAAAEANAKRRAQRLADAAPQTQLIHGPIDPNPYVRWPLYIECKVDPDTGDLYDCQNVYGDEDKLPPWNGSSCIQFPPGTCFDWVTESTSKFGLDDVFFVPPAAPYQCIPWDPDVNIRPVEFITRSGTRIIRYSYPRSSPVTYPVNAVSGLASTGLSASFSPDGTSLSVTGGGAITIKLSWDDDPNKYGTAVSSITILGNTWTQSGESGSQEISFDISEGNYPITFTGLNSANSPIQVKDSRKKLCLKDGDGNDCNAEFRIVATEGGDRVPVSRWNNTADNYAVWTNPAQCTLPCLPQVVTYLIDFPEDDNYVFEVGADDSGEFYFDEEATPFATATTGSMLNENNNEYTGPVIVSKFVTAGQHTFKVICTNGAPGDTVETALYIDSNPSWGSISATSGTKIRDELDGYPDTSGQQLNENGGFDVPSDSPTGKYLSFGTIDAGPLIATRTAQITTNLTGVSLVTFYIIAGTDTNGGERPNDITDILEVNFGTGWIILAPSKQSGGYSFAEYDNLWGNWKPVTVPVPETARTENAVINLRGTGDIPEVSGTYLGLTPSQFEAQYANSGDIFGIYKIVKTGEGNPDCSNPSENALNWSTNPGGWYTKICQGTRCVEKDFIPWVPVWPKYATRVLSEYGVWPEEFDTRAGIPQEVTYKVYVMRQDTLSLEFSADNQIEIYWDGAQVGSHGDWGTFSIASIAANPGLHTVTMVVTNENRSDGNNTWQNNPAAGGFELRYSNGEVIRTSLDLDQSKDGNLVWHTRMAVGYGYVSDCTVDPVTSTYGGAGFGGYMLYVDGSTEGGEFITALKPSLANTTVTSGGGLTVTLQSLASRIIVTYNTRIHRYPEPYGFDSWIENFQTSGLNYATLDDFTYEIYRTYLDPVPFGSGEYIHQQSRGGVVGNYDNCNVRRI